MFRSNALILFCVPVFLLAANSVCALDLGGHDRDGVVIGLDLGHGWNGVELTAGDTNFENPNISTFSGAFKLGWARSDNLVGFIGISGWKRSYYQDITPISVTNFNFLAEVNWYPTAAGFWVKGGIGSGSIDFYATTALPNPVDFKEGGFTYSLGVGYEFRVSGTTALGITYDYTRVDLGDFGAITDAAAINQVLAMSFRWYQD